MTNKQTLVSYYKDNEFNPVPIGLETEAAWQAHHDKRRNLYENHLGIPLGLLARRPVLEFGCNSGENALVLAYYGAQLTLAEPNEQVLPRLLALFEHYDLSNQILALSTAGVTDFQAGSAYEMVIAEGFLYTLDDRDAAMRKVCLHVAPHGFGIVSFNDRYGCFIELTKRALLRRACELGGETDIHSQASLGYAQQLFGDDFARLNASRPFAAWWKDTLVNPFLSFAYLWSYQELMTLLSAENCTLYRTSPVWNTAEHFNWYKNAWTPQALDTAFMENWRGVFAYILTGIAPDTGGSPAATEDVITQTWDFVKYLSDYHNGAADISGITMPESLRAYLNANAAEAVREFSREYQALGAALQTNNLEDLINTYQQSARIRSAWGTPYHYISFRKEAG
jgi:SAM-dependent methyltransferase